MELDVDKAVFKSRYGLHEFRVLPFRLTNAPATFMQLMNDVRLYANKSKFIEITGLETVAKAVDKSRKLAEYNFVIRYQNGGTRCTVTKTRLPTAQYYNREHSPKRYFRLSEGHKHQEYTYTTYLQYQEHI
ncbi:hypothetical protein BGZ65_003986 [Modicella reniformis]|uniref:Uncharacterized protein n=1 Tax=Modicella reniformis TaxID=1440133 RepID=A0A9P6IYZ0_9FUNG|nr:hypothetical protein BGZ65_003986 [Modicella reniformis]